MEKETREGERTLIHAYDEIYVAKAQVSLGQMLRYAVEDMDLGLNEFWDMFLVSGIADLFGNGDYRFIVGMSGIEVAYEVIWKLTGELPLEQPSFHMEKSPTYWTGWILAWYQWYTGQSFRRISDYLMPESVRNLYSPYHEMDPLQFVSAAEQLRRGKESMARLKMYRERLGMSQSDLARASGVSARMIQHYEQRRKDINHAQAQTLRNLAVALHCPMEDLLEPIVGVTTA